MSAVRLIVRGRDRELSGICHGGDADRLLAALSAEPETIDEWEAAALRFMDLKGRPFFALFQPGCNEEPWDAGIVIVDLAARLIASQNSYFTTSLEGSIDYHDGRAATDLWINFRLPRDWHIASNLDVWRHLAEDRRQARLAQPPLDFREVLYGEPLLKFIAIECLAALRDRSLRLLSPLEEETLGTSPYDDFRGDDERDLIRQVHEKWMMTPRDDLRGQTPRQMLVALRHFIDVDLQDRQHQWSSQGKCPPGLAPHSFAFRYGGCGTHENVTYFYLVRHLLWECRDRLAELKSAGKLDHLMPGDFLMDEVPRLVGLREEHLDTPDPEFHGRTPRSIIDRERQRLPEGMSGHEAMIDHDCPLCQMMADDIGLGPMFWHLDGCNMDNEFAFSSHETLEEWEAEQREYEEFSRQCDERRAERERLGLNDPAFGADSVWQRSYVAEEDAEGPFVLQRLFAIGSNLAELTVDLKEPSEARTLIDRLHRDFGNLREVCRAEEAATVEALIQPVLDRFGETLAEVASAREDLREKCDDLHTRLQRFLEPPRPRTEPGDDFDDSIDDIPF